MRACASIFFTNKLEYGACRLKTRADVSGSGPKIPFQKNPQKNKTVFREQYWLNPDVFGGALGASVMMVGPQMKGQTERQIDRRVGTGTHTH